MTCFPDWTSKKASFEAILVRFDVFVFATKHFITKDVESGLIEQCARHILLVVELYLLIAFSIRKEISVYEDRSWSLKVPIRMKKDVPLS
jgi:hypothetical protein